MATKKPTPTPEPSPTPTPTPSPQPGVAPVPSGTPTDAFFDWLMGVGNFDSAEIARRWWAKQPHRGDLLDLWANELRMEVPNPDGEGMVTVGPVKLSPEGVRSLAKEGIRVARVKIYSAARAETVAQERQDTAARIAASAEALAETVDLWEFVAPPFLPESDDVAQAKLNAVGATLIGRNLNAEEMATVLAAYREAERTKHVSDSQLSKIEQAQQVMAGQDVTRQINAIYAQLAASNPDASPDQLRAEAEKLVFSSPDYLELQSAATHSFTPFTAEDIQLQVQDMIGDQAPVEEFGVDIRAAFEGLMAAINNQTTQGRFVPRG